MNNNTCQCNGEYMPDDKTRFSHQVPMELPEGDEKQRRIKEGLSSQVCIDPCIVPEISDLWSKGIQTMGCCCGHKIYQSFVNVSDESIAQMEKLGYERWHPDPSRKDTFKLKTVKDEQ